TATSFQFLLAENEPMSDPAMPAAPKLACRTVSVGRAWAWARQTNGAADAASMVWRADRRVTRDMGTSGKECERPPGRAGGRSVLTGRRLLLGPGRRGLTGPPADQ